MRILIVCSGNSIYGISPFVKEQGNAFKKIGVEIDFFLIKGHGFLGYLKNLPRLIKRIKSVKVDIIHAHYGLSGLLCVFQRSTPVIITFHGSDINGSKLSYFFSKIAAYLSIYNIFVNVTIKDKLRAKNKYSIIPCGVNFKTFYQLDKKQCRVKLNLARSEEHTSELQSH